MISLQLKILFNNAGLEDASRVHQRCGCSTSFKSQKFHRCKQRKSEKAMSSISVASKNCRNKAVAQKTLRIRLKKLQKSLKTLINSTFLACHLFRSPNTKRKGSTSCYLFFLLRYSKGIRSSEKNNSGNCF